MSVVLSVGKKGIQSAELRAVCSAEHLVSHSAETLADKMVALSALQTAAQRAV